MFIVGKILITQFASVRSQQVNGKHNLRGYKVAFFMQKKRSEVCNTQCYSR